MPLDSTDRAILEILQSEGRITNAELANRVGLTAGPVLSRVSKLEEQGLISSYAAHVDPSRVGLAFTTFVSVILRSHAAQECEVFIAALASIPEVLECHHIAGDEDYLLKVVASDPKDYERLLGERITCLPQVQRVKTILVLSTPKNTTVVPIRSNA